MDNDKKRTELLDLCLNRGYKLVIFDSLRDFHSFNENDSAQVQLLMDYFKELTKSGVSVLISHHNRKPSFLASTEPNQILRGSTVFSTGIDSLIAVQKTKETPNRIELVITPSKLRQSKKFSPFKVHLIEQEGKMRFAYLGKMESEDTKVDRVRNAILELVKEKEMYGVEIKKVLIAGGYSSRTIDRALKELKEENVFNRRMEKNRVYFSLKG